MDFYEAIRKMHIVSKLSGITIFTINSKTLKSEVKTKDVFNIFVMIGINYYLNEQFWNLITSNAVYLHSRLMKILFPFLIYGKFFINLIAMIWSFLSRRKIAKIVEKITEIDDLVSTSSLYFNFYVFFL